MARGKKPGFVKSQTTIKDELISPYYVTVDDIQFTLMVEGSTLPVGYFSSLEGALQKVARFNTVENLTGSNTDLRGFLSTYKEVLQNINTNLGV